VNAEARQISAGNVKKREFDIQPGDSLSFLPQKHLLAKLKPVPLSFFRVTFEDVFDIFFFDHGRRLEASPHQYSNEAASTNFPLGTVMYLAYGGSFAIFRGVKSSITASLQIESAIHKLVHQITIPSEKVQKMCEKTRNVSIVIKIRFHRST